MRPTLVVAGLFIAVFAANGPDTELSQEIWEPVLFAVFGAFAFNGLDLLEALNLRKTAPKRSPNIKDPVYWISFGFKLFLAAGLAFAYLRSKQPLTPIVAINVGASAPAILRSLASAVRLPAEEVGSRNRPRR